ncbi:hypothetical protein BGZ60DRAFT_525371 [Tricladium varicosporioides]|nr:hypothetical protein BGZ60DRAFT_525371 [Hymenoscyphus varicosporioides]
MSSQEVSSSLVVETGSNISTAVTHQQEPNQNIVVSSTRDNTEAPSHANSLHTRRSPQSTSDFSRSTSSNNDFVEESPEKGIGFPTFRSPKDSTSRNDLRDYFLLPPIEKQTVPVYELEIGKEEETRAENVPTPSLHSYHELSSHVVRYRLSYATRTWSSQGCSAERIRLGLTRQAPSQEDLAVSN